ncbi:MAG TPA: hypothetical protein VKT78_17235, partial [Fimbriimonadaceae bacterium]|nr:hypothetical protein [Fimbriimonadaceae bacterium]
LSLLFAAASVPPPAHIQGAPRWLDFSIAGYAFAYDEKHTVTTVHDKKRGFFIKREVECDGGLLSLELTRDRHDVLEAFDMEGHPLSPSSVEKPLPSLTTGKGVTIGDSPATVAKRLGKPTKVERTGSRGQYLDYEYVWQEPKSGDDDLQASYDEVYTFKKGKLIQIVFSRDAGA